MCLKTCIYVYGAVIKKKSSPDGAAFLGSHQGAKRNLEAQDAAKDGARAWHGRLVRKKWRFHGI